MPTSDTKANNKGAKDASLWKIASKAGDILCDTLSNLDSFIKSEVSNIKLMGKGGMASLRTRYINFATMFNKPMQDLKNLINKQTKNNNEISRLEAQSKQGFEYQRRIAQSNASRLKPFTKLYTNNIKSTKDNLLQEIERFNIVQKIQKFLNSKGLTGNLKLTDIKKANLPKVKLNVGTVLKVWSLKDIIWDLMQYKEWGTESWWADLKKDIYSFLDSLVIGFASMVVAELIMGVVVAAGATISVGWIIALVAVIAAVITAFVLYFMDENNISFSRTALEGYKAIVDAGKMLFE